MPSPRARLLARYAPNTHDVAGARKLLGPGRCGLSPPSPRPAEEGQPPPLYGFRGNSNPRSATRGALTARLVTRGPEGREVSSENGGRMPSPARRAVRQGSPGRPARGTSSERTGEASPGCGSPGQWVRAWPGPGAAPSRARCKSLDAGREVRGRRPGSHVIRPECENHSFILLHIRDSLSCFGPIRVRQGRRAHLGAPEVLAPAAGAFDT